MELWVAGFPSPYGGADTELDHNIDLLQSRGVRVHLVPLVDQPRASVEAAKARGCEVHAYRPGIFRDRVVASFCNGPFLHRLPEIAREGRPARTVWFNCMTWLFDDEIDAHRQGLIDVFGFASRFQRELLVPKLAAHGPVKTFPYAPYFNLDRVEWRYRPWDGTYRVGRISRDDGAKFSPDTWTIFQRILVPGYLRKKVYILGYGPNAAARIGRAPEGLDWRTWAGNEIPATDFYRTIDTMVHKTGGSRESYCRVLVEAYAHGVVPIVEQDYAFPELVAQGETGFMTRDSEEMSYYASHLAMNPGEHRRMAENGREYLGALVDADRCWNGWKEVLA